MGKKIKYEKKNIGRERKEWKNEKKKKTNL